MSSFGRSILALFRSNDARFIELLCSQADLAVEGLHVLAGLAPGVPDPATLTETVKDIEHRGDDVRRVLIDELLNTYATPFDREDLFELSRSLDDILDAAYETAVELSLYRIPLPPAFPELAGVLTEGARHLRAGVGELLAHPRVASEHAVRAKKVEHLIDSLYHRAVSRLFDGDQDVRDELKAREIYRHLKSTADRIDQAGDGISVIVIKRS